MKRRILAAFIAASILFPALFPAAACSRSLSDGQSAPSQEELPVPETAVLPAPEEGTTAPEGEITAPEEGTTASEGKTTAAEAETASPAVNAAKYLSVTTDALNVRSGAGTGNAVLGVLERNVLVSEVGKKGNWYETRYCGGRAFVHADYVREVSMPASSDAIESIVNEGLRLIGTPYVFGATRYHDGKGNLIKGFSESAFDCSSLMQYIFYRGAGVLLDVTTRTQVKQGEAVEKSDLRRGDLLFFTNASRQYNTGIERIGHVALYLGDGYILHTASDYAKMEKLTAARQNYYICARRMTGLLDNSSRTC